MGRRHLFLGPHITRQRDQGIGGHRGHGDVGTSPMPLSYARLPGRSVGAHHGGEGEAFPPIPLPIPGDRMQANDGGRRRDLLKRAMTATGLLFPHRQGGGGR
jgi:hypothetical protein